MTVLREGITFAAYSERLKTYLQIVPNTDPTWDLQLEGWLLSAASYGDLWMANHFEGNPSPGEYPAEVLIGLYEFVKVFWDLWQSGVKPGSTSVKTDALAESFASAKGGLDPMNAARLAAKPHWQAYRCKRWR